MKLSAQWIRDFVDLAVDDRRLAEDLTNVGISVEGISGSGADTVFEMEIGTNRPDAMNHYGVAREAAAIYDAPLKAIAPKLPSAAKAASGGASGGTAASRALSNPTEADAALKRRSSTNTYAALLGALASVVLASIGFSFPFTAPTLTLICFGLASAFLGSAIFSTPLS
jgi:hypothetical protein